MNGSSDPWPSELRLSADRRTLRVAFDDGAGFELPAEMLRVLSPSAEVQGHAPEQRKTVGGKRDITVSAVDPVGNYAVRLTFADGHKVDLGVVIEDSLVIQCSKIVSKKCEHIWPQFFALAGKPNVLPKRQN